VPRPGRKLIWHSPANKCRTKTKTIHRAIQYTLVAHSEQEFQVCTPRIGKDFIPEDLDVSKRHVARRFKQQCHALSREQGDNLNVVCTFLILRMHTWGRWAAWTPLFVEFCP
jgi:hypothetical protein